MPALLIGAAFFSISLATNFCRYAGERRSGATVTAPTSLSRSCTEGVSIASTVASWSFWMIGSGVPLGKKKPNQVEASKLSPCYCALASSGSIEERSRDRIAIALTNLPSICCFAVALSVQK